MKRALHHGENTVWDAFPSHHEHHRHAFEVLLELQALRSIPHKGQSGACGQLLQHALDGGQVLLCRDQWRQINGFKRI